ncbi:hypothetical protein F5X99DRAFT_277209 [Biscogniauxia marginata]|nr:hypothetical protein F5X99DRAFT_277209 [Biscogniauxia marginata]
MVFVCLLSISSFFFCRIAFSGNGYTGGKKPGVGGKKHVIGWLLSLDIFLYPYDAPGGGRRKQGLRGVEGLHSAFGKEGMRRGFIYHTFFIPRRIEVMVIQFFSQFDDHLRSIKR